MHQQAIYQSENSHIYMYVSILHLIMIYIIILYICMCYMCHTDSHTSSSTHYHVNSPNDAFWHHFGLWYVFLFFYFLFTHCTSSGQCSAMSMAQMTHSVHCLGP